MFIICEGVFSPRFLYIIFKKLLWNVTGGGKKLED